MGIVQRYIFFMGMFMVWMIYDVLSLAWGDVDLVQFLVIAVLGVFVTLTAAYLSSRLQPLGVPNDD